MKCSFDYAFELSATAQLQIDDIGNCCIEINNDTAIFSYLCVQTRVGITKVFMYKNYVEGYVNDYYQESFQQFEYNETKLFKIIDKFIKDCTQARLIEFSDVRDKLTDVKEFMW